MLLASIVWWPSFPASLWRVSPSMHDPSLLRSCVCFPGAGGELYWRFPVGRLGLVVFFLAVTKQGGPLPLNYWYKLAL